MPGSPDEGYEGWQALRTPDRRFIRWDDGQRELYDLAADPWELRNVVTDDAEQAAPAGGPARRAPGGLRGADSGSPG